MTVRQKVRLPPLRLGPAPLAISEGYVTTLKSDHDVDVGECCCSCVFCPPRSHGLAHRLSGALSTRVLFLVPQ